MDTVCNTQNFKWTTIRVSWWCRRSRRCSTTSGSLIFLPPCQIILQLAVHKGMIYCRGNWSERKWSRFIVRWLSIGSSVPLSFCDNPFGTGIMIHGKMRLIVEGSPVADLVHTLGPILFRSVPNAFRATLSMCIVSFYHGYMNSCVFSCSYFTH